MRRAFDKMLKKNLLAVLVAEKETKEPQKKARSTKLLNTLKTNDILAKKTISLTFIQIIRKTFNAKRTKLTAVFKTQQ